MRFLILNTDYGEFLDWHYASNPGLAQQPYDDQMRVRNETLFGLADFYSSNLRRLGHEAWDAYVNNEFMQKAWAREHGVRTDAGSRGRFRRFLPWRSRTEQSWFSDILVKQIEHYRPDVLLNQAIDGVSGTLLKESASHFRLLVGQHAAPLPEGEDLRCYDLFTSSLPNFVDHFRGLGVPAELNRLAFEPRILNSVKKRPNQIPVTFVGSISPNHQSRLRMLERVCVRPDIEVWGMGAESLPETALIRQRHRGKAWGHDMYNLLHNSKITLNQHIDVADGYANNMRLFEATGVGAMLLTDWKVNLGEIFEPGREVVAYKTPEECAELIDYYVNHDAEREAIARAGQQRTLRDHSYFQRMQELVDVVGRYV